MPDGSALTVPRSTRGARLRENDLAPSLSPLSVATGAVVSGIAAACAAERHAASPTR